MASRNPEFEDCVGVFQGGGCRAAAYAGAYESMVKHGVTFEELAGASAGAIAAVLIAAGAEPDWLVAKLSALDFKNLVAKPDGRFASRARTTPGRLWNLARFNGIHSSAPLEIWLEAALRELLPGVVTQRVQFRDLPKAVSVIAADLTTRQPTTWSTRTTPEHSVADAVRASCSIPIFFQAHKNTYADGGMISNLPVHLIRANKTDPRRIVALRLVDAPDFQSKRSLKSLLSSVASTVVDGGQQIESGLVDHVTHIAIRSGDVRATDFDKMTPERISMLIEAGRRAVDELFATGSNAAKPIPAPTTSENPTQTITMISDILLKAQTEIRICSRTTAWVFDLYTALLLARMAGVAIHVRLPTYAGQNADYLRQRATLRALGCTVLESPAEHPLPVEAWVVDAGAHNARAVVESKRDLPIDARILSAGDGDEMLIELIAETVPPEDSSPGAANSISLTPAPESAVVDLLSRVEQYATGQSLALERIPLDAVCSWARYAHVSKQQQQEAMLRTLRKHGIEEFVPYYVDYGNGQRSLALPIVVEASADGRFTVVNGLSRLIALHRERTTHARVIVVRNVTAQPPAERVFKLSELGVRVGVRGKDNDRYVGFVWENSRKVEKDAHRLELHEGEGGEG